MLKIDIPVESSGTASAVVSSSNTALAMKSGSLEVFATPAMIALMEEAACNCLAGFLQEGQSSVGTRIAVDHLMASPLGSVVTPMAKVVLVTRHCIEFEVEATTPAGVIGKGTHTRFIIETKAFMEKVHTQKE